jgi:hypothetical protein
MEQIRSWRMDLGPGRVVIETRIDLGAGVSAMIARGEPPLFRLLPGNGPEAGLPLLAHRPTDPARSRTTWSRQREMLVVRGHLSAESLLYLAYLLLERQLQRHGFLTLHSAAARVGARAVLLLGPAGSGKTTTLLRLCRDHGATLIGNDLVVTGGTGPVPVTLGGSHHLRLRHASLSGAMPDLLGLFPGEVADPWRAKRNLDPARLGIVIEGPQVPVTVVAFVHVDSGYRHVIDEPGDTQVHRLNLYENALRYIRGASTPWLADGSFGPYVPPLDDPSLHGPRTRTLERLMARSRYIAGPPAAVAEYLPTLVRDAEPAASVEVA